MIRKIKIQNIQSHKDTELALSPGVNAIVGSSNNGKSAILRALYWVRYNRPLGTDNLLSHWAFDKKGNQIADMQATVENDSGAVTRRRTKNENQYIVNGEELNVVKTDVPEQVEMLLRLSDTNIQRQQDAPFLLSLTSGQVAQYFNKTVRLDVIDRVLSNAESKRRKTAGEIKQTEELLNEYQQKKEKYAWLDSVEKLLVKYDNVDRKRNEVYEKWYALKKQVEDYKDYSKANEKYAFISQAKELVAKFEKKWKAQGELSGRIIALSNSVRIYKNCEKKVYPNFAEQKKIVARLESISTKEIEEKISALENSVTAYKKASAKQKEGSIAVAKYKAMLPKTCPLCGALMKNGVCENGERMEKN